MYQNPFSQPITPAAETDPEQNKDLIRALLGDETAQEFAELVSDQPKSARQPRPNLKELTRAALAGKEDLLASSVEKQAEQFLNIELSRQFQEQIKTLVELELLQTNEKGENGITTIDGKFYTLPTANQVVAHFTTPEKKAFFERKVGQGFTRLQITPFGMSLDVFEKIMEKQIRKHAAEKTIFGADETLLEVDTTKLLHVDTNLKDADINGSLVYNVTKFDIIDHGGKTKSQLLSDTVQPFPGFRIQLLQEDFIIPRTEKGTVIKDRPAIEAGKSSNDYLALVQTDSAYQGEQGLTPEDWYTLFLTTLHTTNLAIDNYEDGTNSINYNTGSFLVSGKVPYSCWYQGYRQADASWYGAGSVDPRGGVRTAVG